jgi:calcium/calmodulin-dependent protein kinase I
MPSSRVLPRLSDSANEVEAVHIETGKFYAAKVISKRLMAGREHMVRNEIAVLRKISMGHENILTLVDYFETVNSRTYPCFREADE